MSTQRLVGVEDGSFDAFLPGQTTLLCAVCMAGDRVEWVKLGRVRVDGREATGVLLGMLRGERFDALILGGVSFAGFDVVDPQVLREELGVPVIVYSSKLPDSTSTLSALKANFSDWAERWAPIERDGECLQHHHKRWGATGLLRGHWVYTGGSRRNSSNLGLPNQNAGTRKGGGNHRARAL